MNQQLLRNDGNKRTSTRLYEITYDDNNKQCVEYLGKDYLIKHAWFSHTAYMKDGIYYKYLNLNDIPISCTLITTDNKIPKGYKDYIYKGTVFLYLSRVKNVNKNK